MTNSSLTKSPRAIVSFMFLPTSVSFPFLGFITCLSISPVARWQIGQVLVRLGLWVPLPAPGGPIRIIRIDLGISIGYIFVPSFALLAVFPIVIKNLDNGFLKISFLKNGGNKKKWQFNEYFLF
eukprot:NODE_299_length_11430_cov_0.261054.p9 type:complete len:124 gc:universal NODE_299_length_11430_cov_0.261054:4949-4578(-)